MKTGEDQVVEEVASFEDEVILNIEIRQTHAFNVFM